MRYSLQFLRFIFICIISIWHLGDNELNIFKHSVVVEFFFILSGFLLYKTFVKSPFTPPIDYAKHRIKRLYCEYFCALIITLIINIIKEPANYIGQMGSLIPEIFMIQSIGIFSGGINPINWYIHVMLISSIFLYALLYCNAKYALNVLIPIIALSGLTYFFSTGNSVVRWETIGCIYLPLLRGLSCMSIGVISSYVFEESNYKYRLRLFLINLFSCIGLMLIITATRVYEPLDKYVIFFSPFIIIACFEEKSWLNYFFHFKWQMSLGRVSYAMLLIHCAYIPVFHKLMSVFTSLISIKIPFVITLILYLLLLIIVSAVFQKFCNLIRKYSSVVLT